MKYTVTKPVRVIPQMGTHDSRDKIVHGWIVREGATMVLIAPTSALVGELWQRDRHAVLNELFGEHGAS